MQLFQQIFEGFLFHIASACKLQRLYWPFSQNLNPTNTLQRHFVFILDSEGPPCGPACGASIFRKVTAGRFAMVVGPDFSTSVNEEHYEEVDRLLKSAFPTDAEARLVRQLRADGDMIFESRKPWDGKVGGYLALSRMSAPEGWACLAPMAVRPEWQGGGAQPEHVCGRTKGRHVPRTLAVWLANAAGVGSHL
ncbi:GNAT family N-acetyltransferase [Phaeobacter sp. LSS9]|uniref:GNAT family N-acetyltransferase n=1 Tax=unclassified Phaeobacter TaxID=2621772 RepID=UPI0020C7A9C4|nr:hypothetical protein [Phaeobacter sp. LSS9]